MRNVFLFLFYIETETSLVLDPLAPDRFRRVLGHVATADGFLIFTDLVFKVERGWSVAKGYAALKSDAKRPRCSADRQGGWKERGVVQHGLSKNNGNFGCIVPDF